MRRRLIGILTLLLSSFLFAVPASAVELPLCAAPDGTTEFVLIAEDNIIFELQQPGLGQINGNVLVTSDHPPGSTFNNTGRGFVKVGANTRINGTVIADVLILPDTGAKITACVANQYLRSNLTAATQAFVNGICGPTPAPVPGGFTAFVAAHPTCEAFTQGFIFSSFCGPTPVVDTCVNGKAPLTVPVGATQTLDPGCYGVLTLLNGAILNLTNLPTPGPYTFPSIHMSSGSKLIGLGTSPVTVNVNGEFLTDPGATISNIDLNIAFKTTAEVVKIFNNSTLIGTVINAPFGKCHLHTGTKLLGNDRCSEVCCKIQDIEPITAECVVIPPDFFCACAPGFKFLNPWQQNPNQSDAGGPITGDLQDSRTCVPCGPNDHPPLFPTCPLP